MCCKWEDVRRSDWVPIQTNQQGREGRQLTDKKGDHAMPTKGLVKFAFLYAVAWLRVGGVQEYQDFIDTQMCENDL